MPDNDTTGHGPRARPRIPRVSDLLDVTEEMITFADKYQQVWEQEAKATLALGEFLSARSASLKTQVELMRMGNDTWRRYTQWSESIFGVRPEAFMRGLMDVVRPPDREPRRPS